MAQENTKVMLDELYAFMDIPYNLDTRNSTLGCLMHGGDSCTSSNDILGLHRNRDFDPNHWTKELSREVNVTNTDVESMPCQNDISMLQHVSHFEEWCRGVIWELGYPHLNASIAQAMSTS